LLELHLERLSAGCASFGIPLGDWTEIAREVEALSGEVSDCVVKVIVTRGSAVARGYGVTGNERCRRLVLRYGWIDDPIEWARDGVQLGIAELRLGENSRLAGFKHLNRLEQVLARSELRGKPLQEALLFSSSGRLVSGTMTNVFLVHATRIRTPLLHLCGVAGVMRGLLLREASQLGLAIEEAELRRDDLDGANEIFLTNSRIGIWPVRSIGARVLGVGAVTRQLQQFLSQCLGVDKHA
jgi:4-amino-4-deoxychorismate lyase